MKMQALKEERCARTAILTYKVLKTSTVTQSVRVLPTAHSGTKMPCLSDWSSSDYTLPTAVTYPVRMLS